MTSTPNPASPPVPPQCPCGCGEPPRPDFRFAGATKAERERHRAKAVRVAAREDCEAAMKLAEASGFLAEVGLDTDAPAPALGHKLGHAAEVVLSLARVLRHDLLASDVDEVKARTAAMVAGHRRELAGLQAKVDDLMGIRRTLEKRCADAEDDGDRARADLVAAEGKCVWAEAAAAVHRDEVAHQDALCVDSAEELRTTREEAGRLEVELRTVVGERDVLVRERGNTMAALGAAERGVLAERERLGEILAAQRADSDRALTAQLDAAADRAARAQQQALVQERVHGKGQIDVLSAEINNLRERLAVTPTRPQLIVPGWGHTR